MSTQYQQFNTYKSVSTHKRVLTLYRSLIHHPSVGFRMQTNQAKALDCTPTKRRLKVANQSSKGLRLQTNRATAQDCTPTKWSLKVAHLLAAAQGSALYHVQALNDANASVSAYS
jgi:hypothetical protein